MVGTPSSEVFELVKPILSLMGKEENIYQCGGLGAGLATKQLNNYLGYVGYLGLCEGKYKQVESSVLLPGSVCSSLCFCMARLIAVD